MNKIISCCILFFIFSFIPINGYAATYYIAQTAAGDQDASSCANAKAVSWNWASPNVADGDTVYLCGTFTSSLAVPISGTSTAITVKSCKDAEANCGTGNAALFSKTLWGYYSTAAISVSSKSNIILDGNGTGIIQNTDNGSPAGTVYSQHPTEPDGSAIPEGQLFGNSTYSTGIYLSTTTNVEVKNWTVRNIYQRVAYSNDNIGDGSNRDGCIRSEGRFTNLLIHDNTLSSSYSGVRVVVSSGASDIIKVYNNTISNFVVGTDISSAADVGLTNIHFYNNTLTHATPGWSDGCWGTDGYQCAGGDVWHHTDGYHTASYATATNPVGPFYIYNNKATGNLGGHISSYIFLEKRLGDAYFYNNVLESQVAPGDAHINYASSITGGTAFFYNNTIKGTGTSGGNAIKATTTAEAITVYGYGNIFSSVQNGWYLVDGTYTLHLDYNDFYNLSYFGYTSTHHDTLGAWQTETGEEANSLTVDPEFVSSSDFSLQLTSDLINAFPTTSAPTGVFITDILGYSRPYGSAWDIGAYEYGAAPDTTAPTFSSATIPEAGTSVSVVFSEAVQIGSGLSGGWTATCSGGVCTPSYASGAGTTTLVLNWNRTIVSGETVTLTYTQPGNGVEDAAGNDFATAEDQATTNNSTYTIGSPEYSIIVGTGAGMKIGTGVGMKIE